MVRHGYTNCSACHTDPSGGELLTLYGHGMSYEVLSTRWGGSDAEVASDEQIKRRIARAKSGAAGVKSAPKKKRAAAEDEDEEDAAADEEEAVDEEAADDAAGEDGADEEVTDGDAEGDETVSDEDNEEVSAATEAEVDPFEGMSGLTGPLFGLLSPTDNFLIGGSLRLASIYKLDSTEASTMGGTTPAQGERDDDKFRFFPMQIDVYGQARLGAFRVGGSVGVIKVPAGSPHGRPAQITANQGDGYNLISRTHYIGVDFGEGAHTLRAGRLNLPYGIRMSEHVMWVRDRTQTDRESDQQHGLSLYMGFDSVRFELMAIAGNYQIKQDDFRERGYAGYIEFVADPRLLFGASSMYTFAQDDRLEPSGLRTMRQAHGPFLRAAPAESVAILLEANVLLRSRRDVGYVGFAQVDFEPFQGFHLIGTGELLDAGYPDRAKIGVRPVGRQAGLGRPQAGGWLSLQWFFLPHFDMRVDAIIRQEKQILSQLHVYL